MFQLASFTVFNLLCTNGLFLLVLNNTLGITLVNVYVNLEVFTRIAGTS